MPSCQKLRKQDATHAADNLLRAHCWTLLNDWAHGHFVSGVARENGVLCAVITCNFPAYSIARASFRPKLFQEFWQRFAQKNDTWSRREMEENKQKSEIGDITADKCTRSDMLLPDKKSTLVATRSVQLSLSVLLS